LTRTDIGGYETVTTILRALHLAVPGKIWMQRSTSLCAPETADEAMTLSEISELALFTIFVFALVMVIVTLLRKK